MRPISTKLEKIGDKYYMNVPETIVELMGWTEGRELFVPFHEITEKSKSLAPTISDKTIVHKNKIKVNLRNEEFEIKRQDIIDLLENPSPDLFVFKTAYIEWKGEKFGSKAICKKLFKRKDFTTQEGEWYLRKLGFVPKRTYDNY